MAHQTLQVELGERSYPIVIGSGLLGGGFDLSPYVSSDDCLVVTNETVAPLYLDALRGATDAKGRELEKHGRMRFKPSVVLLVDAIVITGGSFGNRL